MFFKKGSILEIVDSKHLGKNYDIDTVNFEELSYAMLRITVVKKARNNKMCYRGVIVYSTNNEKYPVGEIVETQDREKTERLDLPLSEYTWRSKTHRSIVSVELRHFLFVALSLNGAIEHPNKTFNKDNRVGQFHTIIKVTKNISYHRYKYIEEKTKRITEHGY